MKLEGFVYIPEVNIVFTEDEVKRMMAASDRHYDGQCFAAGKPGGFLFGIHNSLVNGKAEWRFTFRKLDLLAKICEPFAPGAGDAELFPQLYDLLGKLNAEFSRLNNRVLACEKCNNTRGHAMPELQSH